MRLLLFGSDKRATRAVVDSLFEHGDISSLMILTKTGLARYAWEVAGALAKDRKQFWLDRFGHKGEAMQIAVDQVVDVGKPDVVLCISPRLNDEKVVRMLQSKGCTVVYGKLDAAKNIIWVPS